MVVCTTIVAVIVQSSTKKIDWTPMNKSSSSKNKFPSNRHSKMPCSVIGTILGGTQIYKKTLKFQTPISNQVTSIF